MSLVLEAKGLTKSYSRGSEVVHALDDVSVELESGELVALLGRSGSGKTTLLNVLAGWENPDSGSISRTGGDTAGFGWDRLAVLPQALGLIEELTVARNILLPVRLSNGSDRSHGRAGDLAARLGLGELLDRYPHQISIGEQQRCALARCLVLGPALVLTDEPTGHQDAASATTVFETLAEAAAQGSCVVVATHSDEVRAYADRVVSMADGRIVPPRIDASGESGAGP